MWQVYHILKNVIVKRVMEEMLQCTVYSNTNFGAFPPVAGHPDWGLPRISKWGLRDGRCNSSRIFIPQVLFIAYAMPGYSSKEGHCYKMPGGSVADYCDRREVLGFEFSVCRACREERDGSSGRVENVDVSKGNLCRWVRPALVWNALIKNDSSRDLNVRKFSFQFSSLASWIFLISFGMRWRNPENCCSFFRESFFPEYIFQPLHPVNELHFLCRGFWLRTLFLYRRMGSYSLILVTRIFCVLGPWVIFGSEVQARWV